ncbi:MAG: taurine catabolism dioxygenase TauD [Candidatus Muproteobacteria bacterium RBG_16_60_9]|uniref:Taurine catabolism dioxygenase TauD n=1 Tax=Candidatus Muproteobacteria bacterium RBG_16_60_9 TaxID=1817755 RepID=A0A1F6V2V7_9PROT|nr:MAG: taurine catabolism dioxygenase TauD [Candidatus Muproteobacteria bacterium RBG_16_60_9]
MEPLELHAEWRARDVADPNLWTYRFTDDDVKELDAALHYAKARVKDVLEITRELFPLPNLSAVVDRVEEELINGRGFMRFSGLPMERYSNDDAGMIYWGIGMHLGNPWPQNKHGHLLGDVTDQGKSYGDPTARGNEIGCVRFPYHTDGSDLVGLMCLRKAKSGGTSTVANSVLIHNEMVRWRPDLAAPLYQPVIYDMRGEEPPGGKPYYEMPIFTRHGDRLFMRYIRTYIDSARRHAEVPPLTPAYVEAFDMIDRLAHNPDFNVYMDFEPGDMQFVNNYHVLHARTAYEDYPEPDRKRFLKRLWLETRKLEDRPFYFQIKNSPKSWWLSKGRTKAS